VKVFISIDLEGISGVCRDEQTTHGSEDWRAACELMRGDLDAALDGCLAGSADEIVVSDAHDHGDNLDTNELPAHVSLVSGAHWGLSMMEGIDTKCDAALLLGYHARAGTAAAVLDHTYMDEIYAVTVQEGAAWTPVGELALSAAVAGAFGVPTVFASGDDKLAAEAQALLPGVRTAVTKYGIGRHSARLLAPDVAQAAITAGAREALERLHTAAGEARPAPLDWSGRALRVTFGQTHLCDGAAACPGVRRLDGRTVEIPAAQGGDFADVYRAFVAMAGLAGA
jgi:D-amino peptidase